MHTPLHCLDAVYHNMGLGKDYVSFFLQCTGHKMQLLSHYKVLTRMCYATYHWLIYLYLLSWLMDDYIGRGMEHFSKPLHRKLFIRKPEIQNKLYITITSLFFVISFNQHQPISLQYLMTHFCFHSFHPSLARSACFKGY